MIWVKVAVGVILWCAALAFIIWLIDKLGRYLKGG